MTDSTGFIEKDIELTLGEQLAKLAPWYFLVKISDDCYTIPQERWDNLKHTISHQHYISNQISFLLNHFVGQPEGKTIADIGCNCGWLSFMLAKYGFSKVIGYDYFPKFIEQADFLLKHNPIANVSFTTEWDNLASEGLFDVSLVLGVFNHVEEPVSFLKNIYDITSNYLVIDCNCFVPSQPKPFDIGGHSRREALTGCNFIPNFDATSGYTFEMQHSRESVLNYLYRAGFSPVLEVAAPLSQPVELGYYNNRFFAIAMKNESPDFWHEELDWRKKYEQDSPTVYVDDNFFEIS